ncbi:MAG: tRNA pseudouridine(55) synthase TruB [Gammaproteobacteria bacterium]|nr:tRNA pseudouridine(55) synthase TruB [Gammaproteobacteria bacterium]
MARKKKGRDVDGILILDKPSGLSSNQALQRVKRLFNANKAGHTGNLDPLASGVLPICLGEATKISGFLLDADKRYLAECRLGQRTGTADSEGEVIETRSVPAFKKKQIEKVLKCFIGEIEQVPPMYSALKHQGQPLYKLARQGKTVERKSRQVSIYSLDLLEFDEQSLVLDIRCSKGTYIRTLAEDIGEALGCGAHISALRRILAAPFDDRHLRQLEELQRLAEDGVERLDALLLPTDAALPDWPAVMLTPEMAAYIQQGQAVLVPRLPGGELLKLYRQDSDKPHFIGIGTVLDDGRVGPKRLIFSEN